METELPTLGIGRLEGACPTEKADISSIHQSRSDTLYRSSHHRCFSALGQGVRKLRLMSTRCTCKISQENCTNKMDEPLRSFISFVRNGK